jgi:histidine kinase/DNA gyrase B/HSP90-like ATPase
VNTTPASRKVIFNSAVFEEEGKTPDKTFVHDSSPNPAKLIESLRYLGYDNYHAIPDIVDNSIDAGAKNIHVFVRTNKTEAEIIIADDGVGMDEEILDQAIRLGSLVEKEAANDLGRFGMGLCTASLSICTQTTVLTKTQGGELLKAVNDVEQVKRHNSFVSIFAKGSSEDKQLFNEVLPDAASGTLVILRNCDNLQNRNLTLFSRILAKHMSRIFRYFITAGINFSLNGAKLEAIDPLEWENPKTEHFDDSEIEVRIEDNGQKIADVIRVKLAILPESAEDQAPSKQNIPNQGFYVLRNNREILDAVTLDFFTKHNDFNRFRGEIHFTGTLDKYMGVNFTKRNIALHQSLADQLNHHIVGQLRTIRARVKKAQQAETPADVDGVHKSVQQEIQRKSKLLMTPKAPKERRESSEERDRERPKQEEPNRSREPREKQQPGGFAANCRFETASMGESGAIYEAEQQGRTVIVRWNSDHPFYKRFVLENVQDKRLVAASDFLVYSLACAELMWFTNEESVQLIYNLKSVMSANMRTLLS